MSNSVTVKYWTDKNNIIFNDCLVLSHSTIKVVFFHSYAAVLPRLASHSFK